MLQLPGTAYGFAAPLALIGLPVILGFLIYVYRRGGKQNHIRVGTLFLLKHLAGRPLARRRFLPPPRFFLELLLLALATVALAGLLREAPRESVALLVDNSLSMGAAMEGAGRTRLVSAVERARSILYDLASHSRVQVFTTSPELTELLSAPGTPDAARDALRRVNPSSAPDALATRVNTLLSNSEWSRVIVVSDRRVSEIRRDESPSRTTNEEIPREFRGGANLAVRVANIERTGAKRRVRLEIASFGEKVAAANITVSRHLADGSAYPLVEREVKLEADGTASLNLDNLPDAPAFSARVSLPATRGARDILSLDDTTWWTLSSAGSRVALFSDMSVEQSGLRRIPGIEVESFAADVRELPPEVSLAIYHRRPPFDAPGISSLVILPPTGEGDTPLTHVPAAKISRWADYPLLQYLHLDLLQPTAMVILPGPAWSEPVVWSEEGPVVRVGIAADSRRAWVGFELLPYEGKESPTLSLFLLNALQWLGQTSFGAGASPVGARVTLPPSSERFIDPEGNPQAVGEGTRQPILRNPGLYRVELAGGVPPQVVAAAIPNFEETNVFEATPVVVQQPNVAVSRSGIALESLTPILLILLALILIGEMATSVFRFRRERVR